jgi:hypothetical protein
MRGRRSKNFDRLSRTFLLMVGLEPDYQDERHAATFGEKPLKQIQSCSMSTPAYATDASAGRSR